MHAETISLKQIIRDERYQGRAQLCSETLADYKRLATESPDDPWPFDDTCTLFRVDKKLYLADGWHRVTVWEQLGRDAVSASIVDGTEQQLFEFICGANSRHALRRTQADCRRTVRLALQREAYRHASIASVATMCCVSRGLVKSVRSEMEREGALERRESVVASDGRRLPATIDDARETRRAVKERLQQQDGATVRQIAEDIGTSEMTVRKVRKELETAAAADELTESDIDTMVVGGTEPEPGPESVKPVTKSGSRSKAGSAMELVELRNLLRARVQAESAAVIEDPSRLNILSGLTELMERWPDDLLTEFDELVSQYSKRLAMLVNDLNEWIMVSQTEH